MYKLYVRTNGVDVECRLLIIIILTLKNENVLDHGDVEKYEAFENQYDHL